GMYPLDNPGSLPERARYLILPSVTLALYLGGRYVRYLRASMLDVLHSDYIRTARGKGLSELRITYAHTLRNALIPLVTVVALDLPWLFSGAVFTETVFSWPGMGRLSWDAALRKDYPVLMAVVTMSAALTILFNVLVDLVYTYLDPQVKYR